MIKADYAAVRQLSADFYRGGLNLPPEEFKAWALSRLQSLIDFDAALLATGNRHQGQFSAVTRFNLPTEFCRSLEKTHQINPLLPLLGEQPGRAIRISDLPESARFYDSDFYRRCFCHYGVERCLSYALTDPNTGQETLLSLYRFDRDDEFSEQQRRSQDDLAFHMIAAASNVYFLHLRRRKRIRPERVACVVDAAGIVQEAQSDLSELLHHAGLQITNGRLPLPIKPGRQSLANGHIRVKTSRLGDLFLVELWSSGPLDQLTPREKAVVKAACQGLSDKEIALQQGVAPATISSHLHRAYKKLGVGTRRGLRKLLGTPGSEQH